MWTITMAMSEEDDQTRADAFLDADGTRYHGWGRARRNPMDPDRPKIGDEIAAARALEDLVRQLRACAEHDVEEFEGHAVHIVV